MSKRTKIKNKPSETTKSDRPVVFTGNKSEPVYLTLEDYNLLNQKKRNEYLKQFKGRQKSEIITWYLVHSLNFSDLDGKPNEYLKRKPTPDEIEKWNEETRKAKEEESKTYFHNLTDAQLYTIAIATKDGETPMYMNKPLSIDNQEALAWFKEKSPRWRDYLAAINRVRKLRGEWDKQFDVIRQARQRMEKELLEAEELNTKSKTKYKHIVKAIKENNYSPEFEYAKEFQKLDNPFDLTSYRINSGGLLDVNTPPVTSVVVKPIEEKFKVKTKDGVVRGHGIDRIIREKKLKHKFDFAEYFVDMYKKKDMSSYDYKVENNDDVIALIMSMGLMPVQAFKYICIGINNERGTLEKAEMSTDIFKIEPLITYYQQEKAKRKASNRTEYTGSDLYRSDFFKEWCTKFNLTDYFFKTGVAKTGINKLNGLLPTWEKVATSEANKKILSDIDTAINLEAEQIRGK